MTKQERANSYLKTAKIIDKVEGVCSISVKNSPYICDILSDILGLPYTSCNRVFTEFPEIYAFIRDFNGLPYEDYKTRVICLLLAYEMCKE